MIKNYNQAISYLRKTIPNNKNRFPGGLGLNRQAEILRLLGDPQNKVKAIHVAGTSGKGSTAFYLSSLLISQGFKVGLTVSPHLIDIRERFQINNQLISKKEFIDQLNQIIPIIEQIKISKFGKPTFFEILIALSFCIFYQQKVDYMIVETGLGGLMDGTNTITSSNQVCVFTKFGLDHTAILGKNITSIATQKAGIIHPQNPVFSINQIKSGRKVLNQTAQKNNTSVIYISPKNNFKNIHIQNTSLIYDFVFDDLTIPQVKINSIGLYQIENSALALSVVKFLSFRDKFNLNISNVKKCLSFVKFPGRVDIKKTLGDHYLILDGAHNPQKMAALIKSLKKFLPNQKFTFVLAFKQRKDFSKMIRSLVLIANKIIITKFKVASDYMIQTSQPSASIINTFKKLNFTNYQYLPNKSLALDTALKSKENIVVTGSLYLLGEVYPILKDKINL